MAKTEVLLNGEPIWSGDAKDESDTLDRAGIEILVGDEVYWAWELKDKNI